MPAAKFPDVTVHGGRAAAGGRVDRDPLPRQRPGGAQAPARQGLALPARAGRHRAGRGGGVPQAGAAARPGAPRPQDRYQAAYRRCMQRRGL
jgi:hypothetical protein